MRAKGEKYLALFLVVSFLGMNCTSTHLEKGINIKPSQKQGAEILVKMMDGQAVRGELITVKKNSLLLLSSIGADMSFDIRNISTVIIVKKSKALQGAGVGFLAALGIGMASGIFDGIDQKGIYQDVFTITFTLPYILAVIPCFTLTGSLFGAVVGIDQDSNYRSV